MSREILKDIIENFSTEKFIHFFRMKNTSFRPMREELNYNDENFTENFTSGEKIGEIEFQDNNLIICAFQVLKELTERSGKKKQYEIGKKILKETNTDAGIFIFYDNNANFRFSLIYTEYFGTKRKFSYFKRFTYFVSKDRTNKTFLEQIGEANFSTLEKIKEAFSVEPVTKQFYEEIANWYFWAVKNVRFPDDAEKEPNGRNIAVIRLITRIIFIWFMKERKLIPNELFNEKNLNEILKDFHPSNNNYYKAILQNLFFATLNTRQEERRFRSDKIGFKGYNTDFGNHNVYRYDDLFKNSEEAIEKYFLPIPFLNGGLFECLDYKSKNKEERKYIDGFTDLKRYQPQVPNYLFFAEEEIVDLSKDYNDTKYRKTKVKGLIKTLFQYNFTIDENEPDDVEIALDPELLGKVFENLLASYNPETETTARKATGSYYTPREIVDYMVDESLKEYFKTHLPEIEEEKLNKLFSKEDTTNPFDEGTSVKLINLIDALRIVDPAVGSGAFPMRVLSRLVFLLHKLDPDNSQWKKIQIDGILKSVKDPILQKELINQVEKRFKEKNPDYGRKLYLIEKCIYGVDIQQIAVEIAKLRFFISLLVDEAIDFDKKDENYGIEPLPNLDFKIMQGNSLISSFYGIYFKQEPKSKGMLFDLDERHKQLISEFEELKSQYQNEPDVFKKQDLRKKIDEKIIQIFEEKLKEYLPEVKKIEERAKQFQKQNQRNEYIKLEKEKLFKKLGFDLEKAKEELIAYTEGRKEKNFFLWDIYFAEVFAEKGGFDIVIGNPPYVRQEKIKHLKSSLQQQNYQTFTSTADLYVYFYEKGHQLLKDGGILSFISSNKWMRAKYGENLRKFLKDNTAVLKIIDFSGYRVFEQTVDTNIILFRKEKPANWHTVNFVEIKSDMQNVIEYINQNWHTIPQENLSDNAWTLADEKVLALKEKIERIGKTLKDWDVRIYRGVLTGYNEAFIINTETRNRILANCKDEEERKRTEEIIKPVLRGRDIGKYYYKWAGLYLINIESGWTNKNRGKKKPDEFFKETLPSLYQHLISFADKEVQSRRKGLLNRDDQGYYWWELRDCDYYPEFEKEKIVWQEIVREPSFAFDNTGIYVEATAFLMTGKNLKYIIGFLNSNPAAFFFKTFYAGGGLGEEGYRYKKAFLEQLPIPPLTPQNQPIANQIITLVDQILSVKKQNPEADTSQLEKQIDQMVYKLYGLTEEEIKIIEGGG